MEHIRYIQHAASQPAVMQGAVEYLLPQPTYGKPTHHTLVEFPYTFRSCFYYGVACYWLFYDNFPDPSSCSGEKRDLETMQLKRMKHRPGLALSNLKGQTEYQTVSRFVL
jgi:hypothetical protein